MAPTAPMWAWVVVVAGSIAVAAGVWAGLAAVLGRLGLPAGSVRRQVAVAGAVLGGWLLLDIGLGAAHAFRARAEGVPWIGVGVVAPLVAGYLAHTFSPSVRRLVAGIPLSWLLRVHAPRVMGIAFLILAAQHRLPWVFALPAGIGDILVGLAAPVAARSWKAGGRSARRAVAIFSVAGLVDFVGAIGTGFLSAPSPLQVLHPQPSTYLMSVLPMVLVPTFLVPLYVLFHVAALGRLARTASRHLGRGAEGHAFRPAA